MLFASLLDLTVHSILYCQKFAFHQKHYIWFRTYNNRLFQINDAPEPLIMETFFSYFISAKLLITNYPQQIVQTTSNVGFGRTSLKDFRHVCPKPRYVHPKPSYQRNFFYFTIIQGDQSLHFSKHVFVCYKHLY